MHAHGRNHEQYEALVRQLAPAHRRTLGAVKLFKIGTEEALSLLDAAADILLPFFLDADDQHGPGVASCVRSAGKRAKR